MRFRTRVITIFLAALMLALPLASADWSGRGFYEPDTARDKQGNFMWLDPYTAPGNGLGRVYFSIYTSQYGYVAGTIGNPNLATTGTAIMAYPTDFHAILGIWKDCNGDGYIGMAPEGVIADYRSELLSDTTICPPQNVNPFLPGFTPVHNDGRWVRELLVIGPDVMTAGGEDTTTPNDNPWNIVDEDARIWMDFDQPEDRTYRTCISLPYSKDNLESTGGFLRFADCHTGWAIAETATEVGKTTGMDELRFDDAPEDRPDQSGSILNQDNPYGRESDDTMVNAWDCSQPPNSQTVSDPTGGQLEPVFGEDETTVNVTRAPAASPGVNPDGSPAGTINETEETTGPVGDCNRDDSGSNGYVVHDRVDTDQEASPVARRGSDFWFEYSEGASACTPSIAGVQVCNPQFDNPQALGLHGANSQQFGNSWYGLPGFVTSRNPYVSRDTLEPWGAMYATGYAYVNPSAVPAGALKGGLGVYGSPHCNGLVALDEWWECNPDNWYVDSEGNSIQRNFQVKVGAEYNLLDIDCYDHDLVKGDGIDGALSLVGSVACQRPT